MVDVKVYYSQREYITNFAESICIKFYECIPENVLITWVECWLIIYVDKCTMNVIQLRFQNEYSFETNTDQNKIIKHYIFKCFI